METKNEHNWNKEYMPFKLWKLLNYEVRHKGDIKKYTNEKDAINAAVEEMDPHDVFGKALIFEVRQNPYYPEGLDQQLSMNNQIMNGQVEWAKAAALLSQMMGKPQQNSEDTDHANT